ncbi:MAG: alpha/beta hydrolase, partial [Pseudomonadota bacterium]
FVFGYGRRLGIGTKSSGWLVALALIAIPAWFALAPGLSPELSQAPTGASAPNDENDASAADDVFSDQENEAGVESVPPTRETREQRTRTTSAPPKKSADARPAPASPPPPAPVIASEEVASTVDERFDTVDILFGTDRVPEPSAQPGTTEVSFGAGRARKLTLGQSTVTIPKAHKPGLVERPWELSIVGITLYRQAEDPAKHFTVQKLGLLSEADFISAANSKLASGDDYARQAVIFVHGYNNDFDTALFRTAQLVYDMRFDGAPFLYSWPSAAGYSSYEYDQQSARQAIEHLRQFIEIVTQKTNAEKIHVVAHSMGNDVLLEALRELRFRYGPQHDYNISQVILAAPDVDRDVFKRLARQISGISDGVTLYASANDKALQISRKYAGGVARAGDVPEDGPVVVNGVDTIDVSATQQGFLSVNHNTFAEASQLVKDIRRLFLSGIRPPAQRTPDLETVSLGSDVYWRFRSTGQ